MWLVTSNDIRQLYSWLRIMSWKTGLLIVVCLSLTVSLYRTWLGTDGRNYRRQAWSSNEFVAGERLDFHPPVLSHLSQCCQGAGTKRVLRIVDHPLRPGAEDGNSCLRCIMLKHSSFRVGFGHVVHAYGCICQPTGRWRFSDSWFGWLCNSAAEVMSCKLTLSPRLMMMCMSNRPF